MSFGKFLAVAVLGLGGAAAQAQLGVYGMYTANKLSGLTCSAVAPQTCSSTGGTVNPSGLQGGVYYDFKNVGPVRLGGDVRGGVFHSNKSATTSEGGQNATNADSVLAGVRATVRVPYAWLKPYVEGAGGWTRSDVTEVNHSYDNFAQYEVFAGADFHVLPMVDVRGIELGIGNMNRFGGGTGAGSVMVKTIGAGIVLHLP